MISALPDWFRRILAVSAIAFAVMLAPGAMPAGAVDTAASAPLSPALTDADRAQAQALIKTLEDPDARAKLVTQLKLLSLVQKPPAPPPVTHGPLDIMTESLQRAGDTILTAATDIADVGHITDWVAAEAGNQHDQERFGRVMIRLVAVVIGGLIMEWLLSRALARPRHYIEARSHPDRWLRLPWAVALWVCHLAPVAGFAASAYAMLALPFYRPGGHSELVSVAVITAYALASATARLVDAVFAPETPQLRVLALDDAQARRVSFVLRRIIHIAVWGYYADDALRSLGMPQEAFESILKLLGLAVTIRLVWLVLEFRRPVARWIRGTGTPTAIELGASIPGGAEMERRLAGLRGSLADVWHILAGTYVAAAFVIWALRVEGGFEFLLRATLLTAAILVAARLLAGILVRYLDRLFGPRDEAQLALAPRRQSYRQLARLVVQIAVAALAALAILEAWGADTLTWLSGETGQHVLGSVAIIVGTIAGGIVVWELVSAAIERYLRRTDTDGTPMQRSARARTLLPLMRNVFTALMVLVVAAIVLNQIGVNVAPLLAGAGVLGVAIGFGSQKLVQDVITGAFILFEDTLAIGDTVQIGDHVGVVEAMTIRTMRIRSGTGDLHTLPFSSVTTVINQSRGFANFPFTVGLSYRQDVDAAMEVMRAVGAELKADPSWSRDLDGAIDVFGIDKFADLYVVVSGQIRTRAGQQAAVGREYYRRLKRRFDELGIVIQHAAGAVPDAPPAPSPAPSAPPKPPEPPDAREP